MTRTWLNSALILILTSALAACAGGSGGDGTCAVDEDCKNGEKCSDEGKCVALCSCDLADECTATAAECQRVEDVGETQEETVECIACTFKSQCDDDNDCTKDDCVDGCCTNIVYTPEEAVGCCTVLANCLDKGNPDATTDNPDGDPCTVDTCSDDHQCVSEMVDPTCCRKDTDCTDENFCTVDTCLDNLCTFGNPLPGCCSGDGDCIDDNPCTKDVCVAGICAHPQDNLNPSCGCASNEDCNDGNECTLDSCQGAKCVYDLHSGNQCCGDSSQCDDLDDTTVDYCKLHVCIHEKLKTCVSDGTCADADACTQDLCQDGHCVHVHSNNPMCCNFNSDCDDANDCTTGKCIDNLCQYQILDAEGCCKADLDCDDGIGCTLDWCEAWQCTGEPVGKNCCTPGTAETVCDDGNPCTIDKCENGLCDWQIVSGGCCTLDDDCLDCINVNTGDSSGCFVNHTNTPPTCEGNGCVDNVCTLHSCVSEFCYYNKVSNTCCLSDVDCTDSNPCTTDTCVNNNCTNALDPLCCANNGMCNDGVICTIDICDIPPGQETGSCSYSEKPNCCNSPADCETKTCKDKFCQNGNCIYVDQDDCCVHDQECNDADICTIDKCIDAECQHTPSGAPGCDG